MSSLPEKTAPASYPCAHAIQALLFQNYFSAERRRPPYPLRAMQQLINTTANLFGEQLFCEERALSRLSAHISLAKASAQEQAAFGVFLEEFSASLVHLVKKHHQGDIALDLPCCTDSSS